MDVRWLGGQDDANLGAGIAFKVTEVRLRHAERADFACPDDPCRGFTFDSNSDNCTQAVRPGTKEGTLSIYGRVECSAPPENCREFRARLRLQTISIPPRESDGGESGGSTQTDEPTEPEPSSSDEQPAPTE